MSEGKLIRSMIHRRLGMKGSFVRCISNISPDSRKTNLVQLILITTVVLLRTSELLITNISTFSFQGKRSTWWN